MRGGGGGVIRGRRFFGALIRTLLFSCNITMASDNYASRIPTPGKIEVETQATSEPPLPHAVQGRKVPPPPKKNHILPDSEPTKVQNQVKVDEQQKPAPISFLKKIKVQNILLIAGAVLRAYCRL
ncbi:MAG: hypothetical protein MZV64_65055 [Ignavibacteriales bacterium]|nr:hypothetical protein [Ignavibacteriales bacterium]